MSTYVLKFVFLQTDRRGPASVQQQDRGPPPVFNRMHPLRYFRNIHDSVHILKEVLHEEIRELRHELGVIFNHEPMHDAQTASMYSHLQPLLHFLLMHSDTLDSCIRELDHLEHNMHTIRDAHHSLQAIHEAYKGVLQNTGPHLDQLRQRFLSSGQGLNPDAATAKFPPPAAFQTGSSAATSVALRSLPMTLSTSTQADRDGWRGVV